MKISALFTDYDGTIAPWNINREKSLVPLDTLRNLTALSSVIPVAVISSKDYSFMRPRTPFAYAWACCSGLEINLANGTTFAMRPFLDLSDLLTKLRKTLKENVFIEEKKSAEGQLIGICIDWTSKSMSNKSKNNLMTLICREGAYIDYSRDHEYLDIYAAKPDKGVALLALKRLLGVTGKAMYLGDSSTDNTAFEKSDVSIGISHGQSVDALKCNYLMGFDVVANFLDVLVAKKLDFSSALVQSVGGILRAC